MTWHGKRENFVERVVLESYHLFQITHHLSIKARHGTEIGIDRVVVGMEWVCPYPSEKQRSGTKIIHWDWFSVVCLFILWLWIHLFTKIQVRRMTVFQITPFLKWRKKEREREHRIVCTCIIHWSSVEGDPFLQINHNHNHNHNHRERSVCCSCCCKCSRRLHFSGCDQQNSYRTPCRWSSSSTRTANRRRWWRGIVLVIIAGGSSSSCEPHTQILILILILMWMMDFVVASSSHRERVGVIVVVVANDDYLPPPQAVGELMISRQSSTHHHHHYHHQFIGLDCASFVYFVLVLKLQ